MDITKSPKIGLSSGNAELDRKLVARRNSEGKTDQDIKVEMGECQALRKKLGIDRVILRREYKLLKKIRAEAELGKHLDIVRLALECGWPEKKTKRLGDSILREIPDALFEEVVGFSKKNIYFELDKLIKQDDNLTVKLGALKLGGQIVGLVSDDNEVKIQVNTGIKLDK